MVAQRKKNFFTQKPQKVFILLQQNHSQRIETRFEINCWLILPGLCCWLFGIFFTHDAKQNKTCGSPLFVEGKVEIAKPRKIEVWRKILKNPFVVFHRSGSRTRDQRSADWNNSRAWVAGRFMADRESADFRWTYRLVVLTRSGSHTSPAISLTLATADRPFTRTTHISSQDTRECLSPTDLVRLQQLSVTLSETNFQIYLGMVNDFGMTPDASFLNQPNGPPITGANPSERSGSPEFMTSGNFFKEEPSNNEGLVW